MHGLMDGRTDGRTDGRMRGVFTVKHDVEEIRGRRVVLQRRQLIESMSLSLIRDQNVDQQSDVGDLDGGGGERGGERGRG